mmetsp:Transcript_707/g.4527  ORF Transcript_707/g.4527 Transcript_707/m.4527 type:complete len:210 (+) Transcript_707:2790-3419(+)
MDKLPRCCNVACHAPSLRAASTNIAAGGTASSFSRSNMHLCPPSKDAGKPRLLFSLCLCIPPRRRLTKRRSEQFQVGFLFCSILQQPSCISFFASLCYFFGRTTHHAPPSPAHGFGTYHVLVLLPVGFLVSSPHSKVMQHDGSSHCHVERGGSFPILRDVHELIAQILLLLRESFSFVAQQESSRSHKRLLLDGLGFIHDLYSTQACTM